MSDEKRKSPETDEDVFNTFVDLFDEVAPDTPEEIDAFLRENGYDPDQLAHDAKNMFEGALEKSPLDWRNRARQEIDAAKGKMAQRAQILTLSIEEIKAEILAIQRKRGATVATHYRNLDLGKMSHEDLADTLLDMRYLEDSNTETDE